MGGPVTPYDADMGEAATPGMLLLIVGFLAAMPVAAFLARRLRLPYTVVLVLIGLVVSALPVFAGVGIAPESVVALLIPGLVFEAAYRLDGDDLRRTSAGVALLAVPGVLVTAAIVAGVLRATTSISLEGAVLVGAMVSATDPVATVSTMRTLRAPGRLVTLIDAESLFNDGTAAVLFVVALTAMSGHTTPVDAGIAFVVGIVGSAAIGLAAGLLIAWLASRTDDHLIELTLTLLAAYGSYVVADLLHESGIIASVVAGVIMGTYGRRTGLSARARVAIDEVWEFLAFVLSATVFLLIGIAIPFDALAAAAVPIAVGVVAVLVGRAVVVYGLLGGVSTLASAVRHRPRIPLGWLHVLNWAGLRGAIATALALSLPADVPDRTLVQGTVFGIVLFTLLVQGPTAGAVMRWAKVRGDDRGETPDLDPSDSGVPSV
jgi:CPA1 family monovalent cation:H+ antiporter